MVGEHRPREMSTSSPTEPATTLRCMARGGGGIKIADEITVAHQLALFLDYLGGTQCHHQGLLNVEEGGSRDNVRVKQCEEDMVGHYWPWR